MTTIMTTIMTTSMTIIMNVIKTIIMTNSLTTMTTHPCQALGLLARLPGQQLPAGEAAEHDGGSSPLAAKIPRRSGAGAGAGAGAG